MKTTKMVVLAKEVLTGQKDVKNAYINHFWIQ